jgi:hypothetical protein
MLQVERKLAEFSFGMGVERPRFGPEHSLLGQNGNDPMCRISATGQNRQFSVIAMPEETVGEPILSRNCQGQS